MSKSVAIITFSTRTPRVGPRVAEVVQSLLTTPAASANVTLSSLDVADFNLPLFDEPILPAMVPARAQYTKPHTLHWSEAIKQHDGYVLVIPEYNYTIAAATKNAIDFINHEWKGKPAAIVSYGVQGGNWANQHLAHSLGMQKIRVVETRPALPFHGNFGPDSIAAAGEGKLGDDTRKDWETEHKEEIEKAFGELVEGMKVDPTMVEVH